MYLTFTVAYNEKAYGCSQVYVKLSFIATSSSLGTSPKSGLLTGGRAFWWMNEVMKSCGIAISANVWCSEGMLRCTKTAVEILPGALKA